MMTWKQFTIITLILILPMISSCCSLEKLIYHSDINQGNYFTSKDVNKIHFGMTYQDVIHELGMPMMSDPFGTNTWFYVFHQQIAHEKTKQQTLTLTFNSKGILINIDYKPLLSK